MELYTYNFCTFLNACHIPICHLLPQKKYDYVPPPIRWLFIGQGDFCWLSSLIDSLPYYRRATEIPYRKCVTMFKCKDYAFYLLPVYYWLRMCSPIMALYLCWFVLLSLPDPLYEEKTERKIHNSLRSVVLMKSGKEKTRVAFSVSPTPPWAAIPNSIPSRSRAPVRESADSTCVSLQLYHYNWDNRSLSQENNCEWGHRDWCRDWAEGFLRDYYWK